MKRLKTLLCAGAAVALVSIAPSSISAQTPRFADADRDGNGRLSYQELSAAFGSSAADSLWRANGGISLTPGDFSRSGDDDDDDGGRGWGWGNNDDDDDGGRDDDDDDGFNGNDDDDDGGRNDDDDDGGRDDDDDDGGRDDDDDDGGSDDDDDDD